MQHDLQLLIPLNNHYPTIHLTRRRAIHLLGRSSWRYDGQLYILLSLISAISIEIEFLPVIINQPTTFLAVKPPPQKLPLCAVWSIAISDRYSTINQV